jgi:S-adenosylmethionine decarboxylase proenzyme
MKPAGGQILAELDECAVGILGDQERMLEILRKGIEKAGFGLISTHSHLYEADGLTVLAIISESHVVIHTYPEAAHASVDIFTCSPEPEKSQLILDYLVESLKPAHIRRAHVERGDILEMQRADSICLTSAEGIDHRVPIREVVYKGRTAYQNVLIARSSRFGLMLVLDDELQVAELDASVYCDSMLEPISKRSANIQNVLLLGGGDGGLLRALLECDPSSVSMVEIDERIVSLSQQYLPEHCLDAFSDPRVSVVYDDVVSYLGGVEAETFTCVLFDLSMHPEAFTQIPRDTYFRNLFKRVAEVMVPGGIFIIQCCSEFDHVTQELLDELIQIYFCDVESRLTYLPSTFGRWRFASARKLANDA